MRSDKIKFRAWTGTKMIYARLYDFIYSMGHQCAEEVSLAEEVGEDLADFQTLKAEKTLMQFTGQQDINGVDIYEGDTADAVFITVRAGKEERTEHKNMVVIWNDETASFQLKGSNYFNMVKKFTEIKVTGNIYSK